MSVKRRSRWVPVAAYASIFVVLALGLLIVLPAGSDITSAPQAPAVGDVTQGAERCLGDRVAFVQSGIFIDVHSVEPRSGGDPGTKLFGGQVNRDSGAVELTGTCAADSASGRVGATLVGTVTDEVGLDGEMLVGADRLGLSITAIDPTIDIGADQERLSGGDLLSRILLAVAVVIVAARLIGSAFRWIGQPRVIGEITAGILLGPSLLGLLFPDATAYLFPTSVTEVMGVLAQLGLIFFMFLIGLELDHSLIRGSGHTALLISHYSIVVPLVLGMGAALLLFPMVGSGDFTGFALFMGAAMAITAFPVLARILTDTGLYKTRLGAIAITCAAVDDVTAWCVLAVVVAIVKASGPMEAITTVSLSLVFVVTMLMIVRPLAARLMAVRNGRAPVSATAMSFLIVGLFLSAWSTELIGIHAIFGAFMFGAILPRARGVATRIIERLEDLTVLLLLPIFFAVVGLSTRIGLVTGSDMWLLAGLIIAIAIVGKVGGSIVAGLAAGETFRSSSVIGVLMNARGITEIVILTIGRELGVISPALFTIMVLMALTTTFMTTPILARIYPRSMVERDILIGHHQGAARRDYGSRRVMVGVANALSARPLVQVAGWLRGGDGRQATIVLASVVDPPGHEQIRASIGGFTETSAAAAANLSRIADDLDQRGVSAEVVTRIGTDRGEEMRLLTRQQTIDMVIVRSHEAYLRNRPLGGLVGELLRTVPSDVVVVVNADEVASLSNGPVGVWLPGEPTDIASVELAASIARGLDRPIRAVATETADAQSEITDALPGTGDSTLIRLPADATARDVTAAFAGVALLVVATPAHDHDLDVDVVESLTRPGAVPALVLRATRAPGSTEDESDDHAVPAATSS